FNLHGGSPLPFALVRSGDEGEDFGCLVRSHRRHFRLEELADLNRGRFISHVAVIGGNDSLHRHAVAINTSCRNSFGAEDGGAVLWRSFENGPVGADAAVLPDAGNDVGSVGARPRHAYTAG